MLPEDTFFSLAFFSGVAFPTFRTSLQSAAINRPSTGRSFAVAPLLVRVQSALIVDRDLFAGLDVEHGIELNSPVVGFHVGVGLAAVVDVMRAVSSATAINTEAAIDVANTKFCPIPGAASSLAIRYALAGIFSDLTTAPKMNRGETTFTINW